MSAELTAAYATCRAIARREAKNFYYAFVALPRERRDAICAIYAFMRQADDLADDESLPRGERRRLLDTWLSSWHEARQHGTTTDPVFMAVRDASERFKIPYTLLDELVAGTTMDLASAESSASKDAAASTESTVDTYATFDDLYHYCYLVASVVGLVCIRIFGYSDMRAEKLAEQTGIAFQLTNILRDVGEDAQRNRVYLPLTDLVAHGVTVDQLMTRVPGQGSSANERALLRTTAQRAEEYYRSARELLPLIDRESRPALWVLVSIYHALLRRIERADYDVLTQRVCVPKRQKLAILSVGILRMAWMRLLG